MLNQISTHFHVAVKQMTVYTCSCDPHDDRFLFCYRLSVQKGEIERSIFYQISTMIIQNHYKLLFFRKCGEYLKVPLII